MESVRVPVRAGYDVAIAGDLTGLSALTKGRKCFVVTDDTVGGLYLEKVQGVIGDCPVFSFPPGERGKNLATVERLISAMLSAECDRSVLVVALGGGVVGDLAGFAAGVYMRGVDYLQVPTSLLAMVDSSVGGKTGVDFEGYKNIVGVFKQPIGVWIDVNFLDTLPSREMLSGYGECVKAGFLSEEVYPYALEGRGGISELIAACVRFKAGVVARDEREGGLRKILNFGHTVGHALESLGLGELSHGEYVLHGMWYEFQLAKSLNLVEPEYCAKAQSFLQGLVKRVLPLGDGERLMRAMIRDKKNGEGKISFILPIRSGRVEERALERARVAEFLEENA